MAGISTKLPDIPGLSGALRGKSCFLCRYFSDTMEAIIAEAKSEGRHERGPINLQATAVHVAHRSVIHREAGTGDSLDT